MILSFSFFPLKKPTNAPPWGLLIFVATLVIFHRLVFPCHERLVTAYHFDAWVNCMPCWSDVTTPSKLFNGQLQRPVWLGIILPTTAHGHTTQTTGYAQAPKSVVFMFSSSFPCLRDHVGIFVFLSISFLSLFTIYWNFIEQMNAHNSRDTRNTRYLRYYDECSRP